MDFCDILLGRPWKYDRYSIHHRILNQYTLWVNGRKKILLPWIENLDEVNYSTVRICMVNRKKIEKEMKKNQVCFFIIPRNLSGASSSQVILV